MFRIIMCYVLVFSLATNLVAKKQQKVPHKKPTISKKKSSLQRTNNHRLLTHL